MVVGVFVLKRAIASLLILGGLAMLVVGAWFAGKLTSSGTASFTARPLAAGPLVLEPRMLNRTDLPVRITVIPKAGESAFVAVAGPADAAAALSGSAYQTVTGLHIRPWTAATSLTPATLAGESGEAGEARDLASLDVWRSTQSAATAMTLTVLQEAAPQTVVIAPAPGSALAEVRLEWVNSTWFSQALALAGSGLVLLIIGVLLIRRSRRSRAADGQANAPSDRKGNRPSEGTGADAGSGPGGGPVDPTGSVVVSR